MNDSLLIEKLTQKINHLQLSFDSLGQSASVRQLTYELHQKQDIISQVNDFYDSAWLKLIIVISILGVLVPIIAQYFQRKNLKDLTEFIRKQMNDSFDTRIKELKEFNQSEINKSLNDFKANINAIEKQNQIILKEIDASTFYLQGRSSFVAKQYTLALSSFIRSAGLYLETERPDRSKVQFVNIKFCLRAIHEKKALDEVSRVLQNSIYKMTLDEMITFFESHNLKHLYKE